MSGGSRITKFCHLFFDGDDQYVFIKNLGQGRFSQAQLVLHIQTCELRVRKVSHLPLEYEATKIPDREKVLFYLQEQAAKRTVQPHISYLYSTSDVPAAQKGENRAVWSRVSYSKYYNGRTVGDLCRDYSSLGLAIPSRTIWRLMIQLVDAIHFISMCGVLHSDIHSENIFLHYDDATGGLPDFYLGDFGNAEHGGLVDPSKYREDIKSLTWCLNRWLSVSPVPNPSERDDLWQYLYFVVGSTLENLTAYGSFPDLKPVIDVLRKAPAGPTEKLPEWMDPRAEDARLPPFYTYEDECVDAVGVDGPWHVAKVSIGIHKKLFTVLNVSPETYNSAVPRGPCLTSPSTPDWAK